MFCKEDIKGYGIGYTCSSPNKEGKCQRIEDESNGEDKQNTELVIKQQKKVAAITQNWQKDSPEMQS
jgi:hypothetical protein